MEKIVAAAERKQRSPYPRPLTKIESNLAEIIRTLRHHAWPEGAPQNCEARDDYDLATEKMIQAAIWNDRPLDESVSCR
jgi:hypothetical protein